MKNVRTGKKVLSLVLALCLTLSLLPGLSLPAKADGTGNWIDSAAENYASGTGTVDDPYTIATAEQLAYLAKQVNAGTNLSGVYFLQTADIDLAGKNWTPIGYFSGSCASGPHYFSSPGFQGTYDGGNYVISNLSINLTANLSYNGTATNKVLNPTGLFGITQDCVIKNVHLSGVQISNTSSNSIRVGVLCGEVVGSTILNCSAVSLENGIVMNSNNAGVGGLIGETRGISSNVTYLANCYTSLPVSNPSGSAGGITGCHGSDCIMANCYARGDVTCSSTSNGGGLASVNYGNISNCYATGQLNGSCRPAAPNTTNAGFTVIGDSVYYLSDTSGSSVSGYTGIGETQANMQSGQFAQKLNINRSCVSGLMPANITLYKWKIATGENDGYPVFDTSCADASDGTASNPNATFSGGDGSQSNPYQISCKADMIQYEVNINSHTEIGTSGEYYNQAKYIVIKDIDMGDVTFTPIGLNGTTAFSGSMDFQNHIIVNYATDTSTGVSTDYGGLIGITSTPTISNYAAAIIGTADTGTTLSDGNGQTVSVKAEGGNYDENTGYSLISNGEYLLREAYGWSGTITPVKDGYTCTPTSRSYSEIKSNQTDQNYTASHPTALNVTLGSATAAGDTYYYNSAAVTGSNIKTILLSFSDSVAVGDKIILPTTTPDGFVVSSTSAGNNYTKRINIDSGADAGAVQAYIRGIGFQLAGSHQTQSVKITVTTETIQYDTFYDIDTQHYYQFIPYTPTSTGTSWTDAYASAKVSEYMGRTGYLATITSQREDIFVNSLSGGNVGWLGGTALNHTAEDGSMYYQGFSPDTSSGAGGTNWYWACGPERGQVFYNGRTSTRNGQDGSNPYYNWGGNEPSGNGETCLTSLFLTGISTPFSWNDITYNFFYYGSTYSPQGYFVEYGNLALGSGETVDAAKYASVSGSLSSAVESYSASISGQTMSGQTLTAELTGGTDSDTLTYQWLRDDGDISGATSQTYKLTDDDVGHMLSVKITVNSTTVQSPQVGPVTAALKPDLTAMADNALNCVSLSWMPVSDQDRYMVYQKEGGETVYQSIPVSTDIKVLNVYPDTGGAPVTGTDDEGHTTSSASLATWMNDWGNVTINGTDYRMNITQVPLSAFNSDPGSCLIKDGSGSYNYDVVFFGSWDNNNGQDLSDGANSTIRSFISAGGGCLLGHDTANGDVNYGLPCYHEKFVKLASDYLNMDYGNVYPIYGDTDKTHISTISVVRKGLLTNYPYILPVTLTVPASHTTYQFAKGDIWMKYSSDSYGGADLTDATGTNNFYLTTWNNVALIQTGHSNGMATADEQKVLTNTLYYLAQVTKNTSAKDHMAQDLAAPDAVNPITVTAAQSSSGTILSWTAPTDNGSAYNYYVRELTAADGSSYVDSDIKSATVTTGVNKYYYLIDQSSGTPDAGTVKAANIWTANPSNVDAGALPPGSYYVHILDEDSAGNESGVVTAPFTVQSVPPVAGSGSALSFDGAGDYVTVPSNPAYTTSNFTVEAWMKYSDDQGTAYTAIVDKGRTTSQNWWLLTPGDTTKRGVLAGIQGGGPSGNELEYDWNDTNWHHVAITYDGSSFCLYVDGLLRGSAQIAGHTPADTPITMGTGNFARLYKGQLDEIKLWSTARTPDQIKSDMHNRDRVAGGLVGYWNLDEDSGATVTDASSTANNGALTDDNGGSAWVNSGAWQNRATAQDTPLVIDAGYTRDGGSVTLADTVNPGHGTVSFNNAAKTLTYTPASDYFGPDSFTYTVTSLYGDSSYTVHMTVVQKPVFSDLLPSRLVPHGQAVDLTVAASVSDGGTVSYRWQRSSDGVIWTDIDGVTGPTYSIISASESDAGNYQCTPVNTNGTAEGTATGYSCGGGIAISYSVTVQSGSGGNANASDGATTKGTTVTLTATPDTGYHFKEWQVVSGGVTIGADNTFTMPTQDVTVKAVFEQNSYAATVSVRLDGALSGLSDKVELKQNGTVKATLTNTGSAGTYAASVLNGTYNVFVNSEDTGKTLTVSNGTGSAAVDYYTVRFQASDAGAASGSAVTATAGGTAISSGATVLAGKAVILTAAGAGADTYSYLWSGAGPGSQTTASISIAALSGAVNATCTVTGGATYAVTLNKNGGTVGSGDVTSYSYGTGATLPTDVSRDGYVFGGWYANPELSGSVVTSVGAAEKGSKSFWAKWVQIPVIENQPESGTAEAGSGVSFSVTVSSPGGAGLGYQWQKYNGSGWDNISGATEATYAIGSVTTGDAGQYRCVVSNTDGSTSASTVSAPAALTVTYTATVSIRLDGALSDAPVTKVELKQNGTVKATLTGSAGTYAASVPNGTYSVFVNSEDTGKTLTVNNGTGSATADYYTVRFTASDAGAASGSAVTAKAGETAISSGATVLAGKAVVLTAAGAGAGYYSYFWSGSGTNGETAVSLTIPSLNGKVDALCTVTGRATPETYSVSLNTNGGAIKSGSITSYTHGTGAVLPTDVTRDGFIFAGWYVSQDLSGAPVTAISSADTGNKAFYAKWRYYTVDGTVVDEDSHAIHGATVTIRGNNIERQTTTTDTNGRYSFSNIPKGEYNIIAEYGGVTKTIIIRVINQDITGAEIKMPLAGAENSIVTVAGGTPDVVVGNLDQQFTSADDAYVGQQNSNTVEIKLAVEKQDGNVAEDAAKIQAIAGGQSVDMYLNMALTKTTKGSVDSNGPLYETDSLLKIIIPYDLSGKTDIKVYRVHNGAAEAMTQKPYSTDPQTSECFMVNTADNQVIVWAKKFSTYAIAYTNAQVVPAGTGSISVISGSGGSITPNGGANASSGGSVTYTITPKDGYYISDVLVDGKSVGAVSSYTFTDVTGGHTIEAVFAKIAGLPYYTNSDGGNVFIGFASDTSGVMKYIAPKGVTVQFRENPKNFTDIAGHWGRSYIDFVTEREIFIGTDTNIFSPDMGMTRAMFATAIGRLYERSYGLLGTSGAHAFTDCNYESWYGRYIDWCSENGIIEGIGGGLFEPDRYITRQEMATMLYRFAEFIKVTKETAAGQALSFPDASDIALWAQSASLYCQITGIIQGRDGGYFAPKATATRTEVAAILERFIETVV